jgi:hypothetical protein
MMVDMIGLSRKKEVKNRSNLCSKQRKLKSKQACLLHLKDRIRENPARAKNFSCKTTRKERRLSKSLVKGFCKVSLKRHRHQ